LINLGGIILVKYYSSKDINGTTEACTFAECHKSLGSNSKKIMQFHFNNISWGSMPFYKGGF
jgi:hypothetical protein